MGNEASETTEQRPGEEALPFDPADRATDAGLVFIGVVRSPWTSREQCPRSVYLARQTGQPAQIEIAPEYRAGLAGLDDVDHVIVLTWLDRSRRDLIVQKPRRAPVSRGAFALRSPVRPNPIGLHVVGLTALDVERGILTLDTIDVLDGTPVIDVKPYFSDTDSPPAPVQAV